MAINSSESKTWKQLSVAEKGAFVAKLCVFLITFGFAFPTILND